MRATQFSDLKAMQKLLADQARAEKEAQAAARLAEQQRQREQQLFAFSIGAVKPIKDSGRSARPAQSGDLKTAATRVGRFRGDGRSAIR